VWCSPEQAKITLFCDEVKKYAATEKQSEWKSIWIAVNRLDVQENEVKYEIWATHMACGDQILIINRSRDQLIEKIRALKDELGIGKFVKTVQPVEVTASASASASAAEHSEGLDNSSNSAGSGGGGGGGGGSSSGVFLKGLFSSSSS
jgi:uncharacterized membrane protein YgcG